MPVITVDDKLKRFSESIIKKVQEESDKKIRESVSKIESSMDKEKQKVQREAEILVEDAKKRAQAEKHQIISRAEIDRDYALLYKRKEILDRVLEDIRRMAADYTVKPEYESLLKSAIKRGLSGFKDANVIIYFKPDDLSRYEGSIRELLNNQFGERNISIQNTDPEILGGCICENEEKTMRVDCTLRALIDENKELIGKLLYGDL